ncbi:hypothetical protein PPS11_40068 [Pseudomonas putida S11]|nr:hypothetical protein PPS11_40068 [Pseudomonas putida S11]
MGGLFGIGGGLIAIPALGVLFGLDQQLAQGTALVMVVPNVLLALWRYHQRNRIELRHAVPLSLCSFVFAWLGSIWAVGLDAHSMRLGFVGFLVALAVWNVARMFMKVTPPSAELRYAWPWLGVLGSFAGTMGGLFGVGGAVVATPILDQCVRYHPGGGAGAVAGAGGAKVPWVTLVTYGVHHSVDWGVGVPLAVGGLLSISWGVKLAHALPEKVLRAMFCVFLVGCAVMLGFEL